MRLPEAGPESKVLENQPIITSRIAVQITLLKLWENCPAINCSSNQKTEGVTIRTYSPGQFAEMLEISTRTAYYILSKGDGPKTIKVGRHIRILEADLNEWFDDQRRATTTDPDGSIEGKI